jgi:hypothetical protein
MESLTKENVDSLSPTFRRCCIEYPAGDLVRERKMSRSEASDSSKDGSIQVGGQQGDWVPILW